MPLEESLIPADWLRIAAKDLLRVERALRDADPEAAGFWLQQSVEKSLKAFLLSKGWKLKRIHDLEALLDDALDYDPLLEKFRDACDRISDYYLVERYPAFIQGAAEADVQTGLESARALVAHVRSAITGDAK